MKTREVNPHPKRPRSTIFRTKFSKMRVFHFARNQSRSLLLTSEWSLRVFRVSGSPLEPPDALSSDSGHSLEIMFLTLKCLPWQIQWGRKKKVPINILNIFMSFHSIHKIFIGDLKKEYNFFSAKNSGRNLYHRRNFCKNMDFRAFKKVKKWSTIHKNLSTEMISKYMCLRAWKTPKNRFTHNSADSDGRNRPIRPIWQNLKISCFSIFWGHFMFIFRIVNLTNIEFRDEITMQKMIILHEI